MKKSNKKETLEKMESNIAYADEHVYLSDETTDLYIKAIAHGIKFLVENTKEKK